MSATSAAWTLAASAAAIAIGLENESLALVAFGAVQMFDFTADVVLVIHFRAAHQGRDAEHLERVVLRIVSAGLAAVGLAAVVVSIRHLTDHQAAESSTPAVVLAGGSFVFLALLAYVKQHLAVRLPSRALHADGQLSAVGAVLAGVTLGGAAATSASDWWWADPVAALLIGIGAVVLGVLTAKDARGSWRPSSAAGVPQPRDDRANYGELDAKRRPRSSEAGAYRCPSCDASGSGPDCPVGRRREDGGRRWI